MVGDARGDRGSEFREDVGYRVRRSREWLSIDSDLSRFWIKKYKVQVAYVYEILRLWKWKL